MKRTPIIMGVLALVALALLFVACGSNPTATSAPAAMESTAAPTASPPSATPPAMAPPTKVPTQTAPEPTAAPAAAVPAPTPEEPREADPSDAYFAMDRVLEISIEITEEDWDTLRHQTRTFDDLIAEIEE